MPITGGALPRTGRREGQPGLRICVSSTPDGRGFHYLFQGGDAPVDCAAGGLEEVTGNDIVDGTVTGRDIRDGSLTEIDLFLRNLSVVNGRRKANVSIGAPRSKADHGLVQVFDENVDVKVTVGLADKGAGVIETFGPSGNTNLLDSTTTDEEKGPQARATTLLSTSSNPDNGFIMVGNPEDDQLAGMCASGSGEGVIFADQKNFVIDHPDREDHLLVQSCMEGPEVGVYYRGTARLVNSQAVVQLPSYFESLTHTEDRTVQLTCKNARSRGEVANGQFVVRLFFLGISRAESRR